MFDDMAITNREAYRREFLGKKILVTNDNGELVKSRVQENEDGFYVMVGKRKRELRKNDSFAQ